MRVWTDQDARDAVAGALHLTDAQRVFATRIGDGDLCAGIRRSVELARTRGAGSGIAHCGACNLTFNVNEGELAACPSCNTTHVYTKPPGVLA